jgi:ribosome-associated heat shock protein Hsp15
MDNPVRIDKWLWAARFFKTRSLASAAVEDGKVRLNGGRVKPARHLVPGDTLAIDNGAATWEVVVTVLADQRGPASIAQTLYLETAESAARRQAQAEYQKRFPEPAASQKGRPTKRARRQLDHTRG